MNARRVIIAAIAVIAAALLAGCGGGGQQDSRPAVTPSPSSTELTGACLGAMRQQLRDAMTDPDAPTGTRPDECEGVPEAELARAVDILLSELFPEEETP